MIKKLEHSIFHSEDPFRDEILSREGLSLHARTLASNHVLATPSQKIKIISLHRRFEDDVKKIESSYQILSQAAQNKKSLTPGGEWLLDNYHVVEQHVRDIRDLLPQSYYRKLPLIANQEYRGFPRVYVLALELIKHTDSVLDTEIVSSFISAYQENQNLSIGELWAIPIMLRLVLIENLRRISLSALIDLEEQREAETLAHEIVEVRDPTSTDMLLILAQRLKDRSKFGRPAMVALMSKLRSFGSRAALTLQWLEERLKEQGQSPEDMIKLEQFNQAANRISIGNCVISLKALASIDWKVWFERNSKLDAILRQDPAAIYLKCDFETRNLYRTKIEEIATYLKLSELEVGQKLVNLANQATPSAQDERGAFDRHNHIGRFLLGNAREQFFKQLSYNPKLLSILGWLKSEGLFFYLASISVLTVLISLFAVMYALSSGAGLALIVLIAFLICLPASDLALDLTHWMVTKTVKPKRLAKLDFSKGVPENCTTLVAIHSVLHDKDSLTKAVEFLEVRYLGNNDQNILYCFLADPKQANQQVLTTDEELVVYARQLIESLNQKYAPNSKRFFFLTRTRAWNEAQAQFLPWERKRGKITELNRLILGSKSSSFELARCGVSSQDLEKLQQVRYVITLDADTHLPKDSAAKLIATIAHPLNFPEFNQKNIVTGGYSIIQPRVGTSLMSGMQSEFSRIFSGHSGLDPYTSVISDVYQDLFGEGSFIGKAIYDVKAFERALEKRVPDNSLLSHDLFEGCFARVGYASDIELYDDFPSRYNVSSTRQHRWVRGDWQLLPWIFDQIPSESGQKYLNPLTGISLWKIFDNLRRSLIAPASFALIAISFLYDLGDPLFWITIVFLAIAFPVYSNLANAFMIQPQGLTNMSMRFYVRGVSRDFAKNSLRALLSFIFLPYQAYLMLDAIIVTLYRVFISKKNLLEWQTAQEAERRLGTSLSAYYSGMKASVFVSAIILVSALILNPYHWYYFVPFCSLWICNPLIAWYLSLPEKIGVHQMDSNERSQLIEFAHDTWSYFDDYVNQENHYLIPDNIQLYPKEVLARRTSPTNIGLSLTALLSAYDFGFTTQPAIFERIAQIYDTLNKLERYKGHFLNWYETISPGILYPKYISTVDSGNFAGTFIVVKNAAKEAAYSLIICPSIQNALKLIFSKYQIKTQGHILELYKEFDNLFKLPLKNTSDLFQFTQAAKECLKLLPQIRQVSQVSSENDLRFERRLNEVCQIANYLDFYQFIPKIKASLPEAQHKSLLGLEKILAERLPTPSLLVKIYNRCDDLANSLNTVSTQQIFKQFKDSISISRQHLDQHLALINQIQIQSQRYFAEMDFKFLYNSEKGHFVIGYNVDNARLDQSFYDLLASESRLASLLAIAKGDVPQAHWFLLGRSLADSDGGKALLSWSATMFEYLMPTLFTKDYPSTLLSETYRAVVKTQQAYGRKRKVPWGVSESGYAGVDFEHTYQYKAFGVPGIGLKRGLSEDLVVSPYSTFLALLVDLRGSLQNIMRLEALGVRGRYGFYESIDFTKARLSHDEKYHVVKSYFAHHQGMILAALDNVVNNDILRSRFHHEPAVQSVELLLQEKFPTMVPSFTPHQSEVSSLELADREEQACAAENIASACTAVPRTRVLSNGQMTVMADNAGSGFLNFSKDFALTRWNADPLINDQGYFIYVKDLDTQKIWSVTYQPTRVEPESYEVIFNPEKIEYKRRDFDIALHTEVTISPEHNVEIRRITATNLSQKRRNLQFTSYAEVVLGSQLGDRAHPAFSKMFVESEYIEEIDALLFTRRPRGHAEKRMYMLHLLSMRTVWDRVYFESDRMEFIGRNNNADSPLAVRQGRKLGKSGVVLDPIFSLSTKVQLDLGASESLSFITLAGEDRDELLKLAHVYRDEHAIRRAFELAWSQSNVELRQESISMQQVRNFQLIANALFFDVPSLRAENATVSQNRLTQSALWRFGISGDMPIVLVRITSPDQLSLVREMLAAHAYLRQRCQTFDLVILNEYPGGYLQNFQHELELLIKLGAAAKFFEQKGGIYLRTAGQLSLEERRLLEALAKVILHGEKGDLVDQLNVDQFKVSAESFDYPLSLVNLKKQKSKLDTNNLEFYNSFGGFIENGQAYAINLGEESTPLPWSNVIANPNFGFLITESGGGYTWSENSRENRLSTWSNDPVSDRPSEIIYIRDHQIPNQEGVWSATPSPASKHLNFRVEHHFGWSSFETENNQIKSTLKVIGSTTQSYKNFKLKLKNLDSKPRRLEVYLYVDLVLGVLRQTSKANILSNFDPIGQFLYAQNHYNNEFAGKVALISSNLPIRSYTADRSEFIGINGSYEFPRIFDKRVFLNGLGSLAGIASKAIASKFSPLVELSNKVGAKLEPCAAIKVVINELAVGEEKEINFFLAESPNLEEARKLAANLKTSEFVKKEAETVDQYWQSRCAAIQVKTPARSFDLLMNGFLVYQTMACRIFGRSGFYQSGGAFGFRDQLQDVLSLLYIDPAFARQQILTSAARQFIEGDVQHWWHPPTGRGVRTRISDDFLWLPFVVEQYLNVTADYSILEEMVGFIEAPLLQEGQHDIYLVPSQSTQKASIYEHCLRAIRKGFNFGTHGLPLIGAGDWNDGMNEVGKDNKGESVWLAWFLADVLSKFSKICILRNDQMVADEFSKHAKNLVAAIEKSAWDGQWYRRAYFDDGTALGSQLNDECKIDSISQTWSIISGLGDKQRSQQALQAVYQKLVKEDLILLLDPPFNNSKLEPGYIKGYLPGVRENGGQYTHAATWVVLAAAMNKDGNQALKLFELINPINHSKDRHSAQVYKTESYVTCGDVYSVEPHVGRGGWSWYTGSSGWLYRVGLEYILGLKLTAEYLSFDPCIPSDWPSFEISFKHKNSTYQVKVENPKGKQFGVESVEVNGTTTSDHRVSLINQSANVNVRVIMG